VLAGPVAGEFFNRVEGRRGGTITYAGLLDGRWLVATISGADRNPPAAAAFEASVRSIRRREPSDGTKLVDPFSVPRLVARLNDDPDHAAALLRSRADAAGLEDALIPVLAQGNARAKRAAIDLLADRATAKSVPALRQLAASGDRELSEAAKSILQRVAPQNFDAVAIALLDLKNSSVFKRREAFQVLARTPRDPKRPEVTRALEDALLAEDLSTMDDAAAALASWAVAKTAPMLLPWVDENAGMFKRRAALTALPGTRDKRAVFPIVRWIIKEPELAQKALIAMGPVAEDEVVKLLRERDAASRLGAARVLQEIGGTKSLAALQRASTDPRDAGAANAAKVALEMVRERVKQSKASATTKPE
jgi:HEAT repeat protein